MKRLTVLAGLVVLTLLYAPIVFAQTSEAIKALKEDGRSIKEGQTAASEERRVVAKTACRSISKLSNAMEVPVSSLMTSAPSGF